ncbi:hypothetical protein AB6A40_001822 [Gnathostoma spinigerum]|uniref:Uncharacterized protein n=1 Tax=Gnathostoma spinigerum TaxID=75299 RepID=A0ABD6E530_9BILA
MPEPRVSIESAGVTASTYESQTILDRPTNVTPKEFNRARLRELLNRKNLTPSLATDEQRAKLSLHRLASDVFGENQGTSVLFTQMSNKKAEEKKQCCRTNTDIASDKTQRTCKKDVPSDFKRKHLRRQKEAVGNSESLKQRNERLPKHLHGSSLSTHPIKMCKQRQELNHPKLLHNTPSNQRGHVRLSKCPESRLETKISISTMSTLNAPAESPKSGIPDSKVTESEPSHSTEYTSSTHSLPFLNTSGLTEVQTNANPQRTAQVVKDDLGKLKWHSTSLQRTNNERILRFLSAYGKYLRTGSGGCPTLFYGNFDNPQSQIGKVLYAMMMAYRT